MGRHALSAEEVVNFLSSAEQRSTITLIDVRSAGEYQSAALPYSHSLPILNDEERAQVGTVYKYEGQARAIALGHQLVAPTRDARVEAWVKATAQKKAVVMCWRGGLRSKTACDWLSERGIAAWQVAGGYKAVRERLLAIFEGLSSPTVLTGLTGSNKTKLLRELERQSFIDLERHAKHRGSSFGALIDGGAQPAQATFENHLAIDIATRPCPLLFEDESPSIGKIYLPRPLVLKLRTAQVISLEVDIEQRISNIYEEYVVVPLRTKGPAELAILYQGRLLHLKRRLGLEKVKKISDLMRDGFATAEVVKHREWIKELLVSYYDRAYEYGIKRFPRAVVFRGDEPECRAWIQAKFV